MRAYIELLEPGKYSTSLPLDFFEDIIIKLRDIGFNEICLIHPEYSHLCDDYYDCSLSYFDKVYLIMDGFIDSDLCEMFDERVSIYFEYRPIVYNLKFKKNIFKFSSAGFPVFVRVPLSLFEDIVRMNIVGDMFELGFNIELYVDYKSFSSDKELKEAYKNVILMARKFKDEQGILGITLDHFVFKLYFKEDFEEWFKKALNRKFLDDWLSDRIYIDLNAKIRPHPYVSYIIGDARNMERHQIKEAIDRTIKEIYDSNNIGFFSGDVYIYYSEGKIDSLYPIPKLEVVNFMIQK